MAIPVVTTDVPSCRETVIDRITTGACRKLLHRSVPSSGQLLTRFCSLIPGLGVKLSIAAAIDYLANLHIGVIDEAVGIERELVPAKCTDTPGETIR
jgi:hypothetical protein